jgi:transposase InsO family protein
MRHNPAAGAVVIMLRTLKMHGMAQAVGELTEQGSPAFEAALPILSQPLKAETVVYQLKAARFPNYCDLAGFDFASSEVNEALVLRGSMIAIGNPYHNAQAESFMKTLKVEDVYVAGYDSFPDVAERLPKFIEQLYNSRRLHSALGYRTPEEFETQHTQKAA